MDIKVSNHARDRFAERIMGKDEKIDIINYVNQNLTTIDERLSKMIEFGIIIYSGSSISEFNKEPVDIYLSGLWVLIVDKKRQNLITVYKIDLGLGDNFNEQYVTILMDKLEEEKKLMYERKETIHNQLDDYKNIVDDNDKLIAEYRKIVKSLEEQNQGYKDVINNLYTNESLAETEVRKIIGTLIGKKIF